MIKKSLILTFIVLLCISIKTLLFYKNNPPSSTTVTQIQDDRYGSPYQYASEENKSPNTNIYEDKLNIADYVYHIGAVINKIDQLVNENHYTDYQIIHAELFGSKDDYHTAYFTICFDNKDYYMIEYLSPYGAIYTKANEQTIKLIEADLKAME